MSAHDDCIFCKIINGDIPSFKVLEDEHTLAFMDINPANEGHCLVIPKEHARDLFAISADAVAAVARSARRVARAVQAVLQPDGINLVQCNGAAAGQSVYHFHMHVLPRANDDGLAMNWGIEPGDMQAIGELATRIAAKIE